MHCTRNLKFFQIYNGSCQKFNKLKEFGEIHEHDVNKKRGNSLICGMYDSQRYPLTLFSSSKVKYYYFSSGDLIDFSFGFYVKVTCAFILQKQWRKLTELYSL